MHTGGKSGRAPFSLERLRIGSVRDGNKNWLIGQPSQVVPMDSPTYFHCLRARFKIVATTVWSIAADMARPAPPHRRLLFGTGPGSISCGRSYPGPVSTKSLSWGIRLHHVFDGSVRPLKAQGVAPFFELNRTIRFRAPDVSARLYANPVSGGDWLARASNSTTNTPNIDSSTT